MYFLAARSTKEIAVIISLVFLLLFATLITASSRDAISLFTASFLLEDLNALLAVFVTGTFPSIIEQG